MIMFAAIVGVTGGVSWGLILLRRSRNQTADTNGAHSSGASGETEAATLSKLRSLPKYTWGDGTATGDNEECSLCMEEYSTGDELCRLPCRHYFHRAWCAAQSAAS